VLRKSSVFSVLAQSFALAAVTIHKDAPGDIAAQRENYLYLLETVRASKQRVWRLWRSPCRAAFRGRAAQAGNRGAQLWLTKSIERWSRFAGPSVRGALFEHTNETRYCPVGKHRRSSRAARPEQIPRLRWEQGKIAQHATESEDKTAAVIDVEAKLKNQTDFRDSLRRMLTKPGVSVATAESGETRGSSGGARQRSHAAQGPRQRNRKVYVEIAFHAEQRTISRGSFASVGEALRDFAPSLATASPLSLPPSRPSFLLIVLIPGYGS